MLSDGQHDRRNGVYQGSGLYQEDLWEWPDFAEPYLDKLDNEISQMNYVAMQKFYQEIDVAVKKLNSTADSQFDDEPEEFVVM